MLSKIELMILDFFGKKTLAKMLLVFVLILSAKSLTCGGNCPLDTCSYCPCGNTTSYIDVDTYCKYIANGTSANVNCCKCIVARISKGN